MKSLAIHLLLTEEATIIKGAFDLCLLPKPGFFYGWAASFKEKA